MNPFEIGGPCNPFEMNPFLGHELPSVITESMLRAASGNFTELEKLGPSVSSLVQSNVPQVNLNRDAVFSGSKLMYKI